MDPIPEGRDLHELFDNKKNMVKIIIAKRLPLALAAFLAFFLQSGAVFGTQNSIGRIDYHAIPAETLTARSGAFVGNCGEAIVVAGGYNPDGSLSAEIQVLAPGEQVWTTSALQVPRAFGACAAFRNSLILAGGVEGQGVSSRVTKLVWSKGTIEAEALPDLPEPRMLAGAVVHGNLLYVAGGIGELNGTVASRDVYVLDLAAPFSAWCQLEKLPGTGRIEPMVNEASTRSSSPAVAASGSIPKAPLRLHPWPTPGATEPSRIPPEHGWDGGRYSLCPRPCSVPPFINPDSRI
jgi:hypothetical protein